MFWNCFAALQVAGNTTEYVNTVIAKVEAGDPKGGLEMGKRSRAQNDHTWSGQGTRDEAFMIRLCYPSEMSTTPVIDRLASEGPISWNLCRWL